MNIPNWRLAGLVLLIANFLSACSKSEVGNQGKVPAQIATIKVQKLDAVPLDSSTEWKDVPSFLTNAKIYRNQPGNDSTQLQFDITSEGIIVVAAKITYTTGATGAQSESGIEDDTMISKFFTRIGEMSRIATDGTPSLHRIYYRKLLQGEKVAIDFKTPNPPLLILPAPDRAKEITSVKPLVISTKSHAQNALIRSEKFSNFEEKAENESVLVGLRATINRSADGAKFTSIQPLFESVNGRYDGKVIGKPYGSKLEVHAKPGFAVGGMIPAFDQTKSLSGFRVIFQERAGNSLERTSNYQSRWLGDDQDATAAAPDLSESPFIGIRGETGNYIKSIELIGNAQ